MTATRCLAAVWLALTAAACSSGDGAAVPTAPSGDRYFVLRTNSRACRVEDATTAPIGERFAGPAPTRADAVALRCARYDRTLTNLDSCWDVFPVNACGAAAASGVWHGAATSLGPVTLTQPPCSYSVRFSNLTSTIDMDANRQVRHAEVSVFISETGTGCGFAAPPPRTFTFRLRGATSVDDGVRIQYVSDGGMELTLDARLTATQLAGTLSFYRRLSGDYEVLGVVVVPHTPAR
jgi:hypothetical protein